MAVIIIDSVSQNAVFCTYMQKIRTGVEYCTMFIDNKVTKNYLHSRIVFRLEWISSREFLNEIKNSVDIRIASFFTMFSTPNVPIGSTRGQQRSSNNSSGTTHKCPHCPSAFQSHRGLIVHLSCNTYC